MKAHINSAASRPPVRFLGLIGGAAIALGGLAGISPVQAQVFIGDYGQINGLSPISAGVTPPDGGVQTLLTTENSAATHDGGTVFTDATNADRSTGAVPVSTLGGFIGADPAVINYSANSAGTEGSAAFMEETITGPTVLSLEYDFVTSELVGAANVHPDFAFVTEAQVDDSGDELAPGSFTLLASAADAAGKFQAITDPLGTSPFDLQEGYQKISITLTTAGNYIFGLGVADADTFDTQSGLFLDDITVTAVPEPGTGTLLLLAAGTMAYFARARSRRFRATGGAV